MHSFGEKMAEIGPTLLRTVGRKLQKNAGRRTAKMKIKKWIISRGKAHGINEDCVKKYGEAVGGYDKRRVKRNHC